MSRLHFSPVPVSALGNWIPAVLNSWGCTRHRCGLAQAAFTSEGKVVVVVVVVVVGGAAPVGPHLYRELAGVFRWCF